MVVQFRLQVNWVFTGVVDVSHGQVVKSVAGNHLAVIIQTGAKDKNVAQDAQNTADLRLEQLLALEREINCLAEDIKHSKF